MFFETSEQMNESTTASISNNLMLFGSGFQKKNP
jgi:hypothetical protein